MFLANVVIPMPIPIHFGGAGGNMSIHDGILILLGTLYLTQIIMTWLMLYVEGFNSKLSFIFWHVPFIPVIVKMIKMFVDIGKE